MHCAVNHAGKNKPTIWACKITQHSGTNGTMVNLLMQRITHLCQWIFEESQIQSPVALHCRTSQFTLHVCCGSLLSEYIIQTMHWKHIKAHIKRMWRAVIIRHVTGFYILSNVHVNKLHWNDKSIIVLHYKTHISELSVKMCAKGKTRLEHNCIIYASNIPCNLLSIPQF